MGDKEKMILQKLMAQMMRDQAGSGPVGGLMDMGATALDLSADFDEEERKRKALEAMRGG